MKLKWIPKTHTVSVLVCESQLCQRQREMRYDTEIKENRVDKVAHHGVKGMATFPSVNA